MSIPVVTALTGNRFPNQAREIPRGFLAKFNSINFKEKRRVPPFFQGSPSVGAMPIKTRHFANDMHGFALFRNDEFARFELGHDVTSVQERLCV